MSVSCLLTRNMAGPPVGLTSNQVLSVGDPGESEELTTAWSVSAGMDSVFRYFALATSAMTDENRAFLFASGEATRAGVAAPPSDGPHSPVTTTHEGFFTRFIKNVAGTTRVTAAAAKEADIAHSAGGGGAKAETAEAGVQNITITEKIDISDFDLLKVRRDRSG